MWAVYINIKFTFKYLNIGLIKDRIEYIFYITFENKYMQSQFKLVYYKI